jgi:hypothetical protein
VEWMVVEVNEDNLEVDVRKKTNLFSNANKSVEATSIAKISETDSEIKFLWTYQERVSTTYTLYAQVLTYFKTSETISSGTAVSIQAGAAWWPVKNQSIWMISPTSAILVYQSQVVSPQILRRARLTISGSTITVVNVSDITGTGATFGMNTFRIEPINSTTAVITMYDQQFGESKMCSIDSSGVSSALVSLGLGSWGNNGSRLIRLWDASNAASPVFILSNVEANDYGLGYLSYVKFAYNIGPNTISWIGGPSVTPPDEDTGSGDSTWVVGDTIPYITDPLVAESTYGSYTDDGFIAHDGTYIHTHHTEYEPTFPDYVPYYVGSTSLLVTHTDIDGKDFKEAKFSHMTRNLFVEDPLTESYQYVDGYGRGENYHMGATYFGDDKTIGIQVYGAFYEIYDIDQDDYWDLFQIEGYAFRYNKVAS